MLDNWNADKYQETIVGLRRHLRAQCRLSSELREHLAGGKARLCKGTHRNPNATQSITYRALLHAIEISIGTILLLSRKIDERIRDCFPIARSIVETGINVAFIAASGESSAESARQHSLRRSYKDLDSRLEIGSIKLHRRSTALDDPERPTEIRMALQTLTNLNGPAPRDWTSFSTPKRLEVILAKLGEKIAAHLVHSYFLIYRDASEILHGSVYGYYLSRGKTMRDQALALHDHAFRVLFASSMSLNRGVAAIGAAHNMKSVVETADSFDLLLTRIPAFAEALSTRRTAQKPPN